MDANLKETLRRRHEARIAALADERRRQEEEEAARIAAEEEERRQVQRREDEEQAERLLPLVQLQGELSDLVALVRTAERPGQVIPALRRVAANVQELYSSDIPGGQELVVELQTATAELVIAFNDNQRLILQVGSYEYRTVQELIQVITTTLGVDIEIGAPVMDTSRDEEIARQLAEPQGGNWYQPPAAASSSSSYTPPVRVAETPELDEYRNILMQLKSMRYTAQSQLHSILRQLQPPPDNVSGWQRDQLLTALQNLLTYIRNRWSRNYDLTDQMVVLEDFIAML